MLLALEPAALELSLRAIGDAQAERRRLDRQWQLRLERSRFDAERAARQYQACEPEKPDGRAGAANGGGSGLCWSSRGRG